MHVLSKGPINKSVNRIQNQMKNKASQINRQIQTFETVLGVGGGFCGVGVGVGGGEIWAWILAWSSRNCFCLGWRESA